MWTTSITSAIEGANKTGTIATVAGASAQQFTTDEIVVCFAYFDNLTGTTPTVSSISKPAGETNSWIKAGGFTSPATTAGTALLGEVWYITASTTTTHTITVTLSAITTAKAMASFAVRGESPWTVQAANTASSQTSPVSTSTSTNGVGDLVLGFAAHETSTAMSSVSLLMGGAAIGLQTGQSLTGTSGGIAATNVRGYMREARPGPSGTVTWDQTTNSDGGAILFAIRATPSARVGVPL